MNQFQSYVKELFEWNSQMKDLLEAEEVGKSEEVWRSLDGFVEVLEGISKPLTNEEMLALQKQAEKIHENMEDYFLRQQEFASTRIPEAMIQPGKHSLPPLPYSYQALEPFIDRKIMELHHDKHHQSYVDGLNKAELQLQKARLQNDFSLVKHFSRELAFHGSGHYLHTIFWNNMKPNGGGQPGGRLLKEIIQYFGSFDAFKNHFTEAAKQVEGSGWALLVWSPRSRHLEVLQSESHMHLTQWDTIPLLVLDVWEHAYYLQYKNNRAEYVKNWWNVVNWKDVEGRFEKARQLKWEAF